MEKTLADRLLDMLAQRAGFVEHIERIDTEIEALRAALPPIDGDEPRRGRKAKVTT